MKDTPVTAEDLQMAMESFTKALAQSIEGADLGAMDRPALIKAISQRLDQEARAAGGAASAALQIAASKLRSKVEQ